ncbi:RHS repeat protein [Cohnella fermenti]|nr:RHS repeat protein [Cohnella fermenti]
MTTANLALAEDDASPFEGTEAIQDTVTIEAAIMNQFNVTEVFLQQQIEAGYTLNQINSALWKAQLDNISYEEAVRALFPVALNLSQSATGAVYNQLPAMSGKPNPIRVLTEEEFSVASVIYEASTEDSSVDSSVEDATYGHSQGLQSLAMEEPPILENPPVYNMTSISKAPYSVGDNGESYSTLSGGMSITQSDMQLPGRGGLSFALTRQYTSEASQFYDMTYEATTYPYTVYYYAVVFSGILRPILTQYNLKYKENKWVQQDNDSDGAVDYETSILESSTVTYNSYDTEAAALAAKASGVKYPSTMPADSLYMTDYRTSSTTTSFPASIYRAQNGYSGNLYKTGSPFVSSGSYTAAASRTETDTCTTTLAGQYNSQGVWSATGTATSCPLSKTYDSGGFTGTLNRVDTIIKKECPSPSPQYAGYTCTKEWQAQYSGTVTKPASDTRVYRQNYDGYIQKPADNSQGTTKYGAWTSSNGIRWRYAYQISGSPWIETSSYEGAGSPALLSSNYYSSYTDALAYQSTIQANSYIDTDGTYKYYVSSEPNATIVSVPVGSSSYTTYSNKTTIPLEEQLYPIGKGWSWQLPYLVMKDGKTFVHLADGGTYQVEGSQLKGYAWQGLSFNTDTSVTVNGEASQYVLTSADGNMKQHFTADGRLLQVSDAHSNTLRFSYSDNANYGRKLLSHVTDIIGNSIDITYSASEVVLTNGEQTVTYKKHTEQGKELLDSVTDVAGRKTVYSYTLASAQFNLMADYADRAMSNPYALLTGIQHPTGAVSQYNYESTPVKRYTGTSSYNQVYRLQSRYDQLLYEGGQTETYNRKTFSYGNSDMGSSYNEDISFSVTVDSGLNQATYTYGKDYIDDVTPVQFYLNRQVEAANGLSKITDYTYGKKVGANTYSAPAPTTITASNNLNSDVLTTAYSYDDYGNVTSETAPNGANTLYTYDNKHLIQSISEPIDQNRRNYTAFTRNSFGDVTQIVVRANDQNGAAINQVSYPEIDSYGNVKSQIVQNNGKNIATTFEYSDLYLSAFMTRQSVVVTDADGHASTIANKATYDSLSGQVKTWTDGNNHSTEYEYDALGRVIQVTQPGNKIVTAAYDDTNNTVVVTDEVGIQTKTTWNALGLKVEEGIYDSQGYKAKLRYGYDDYGRLIWSENAKGYRTYYGYDNWGRLTTTVYADQSLETVIYDDASRSVTNVDGAGNKMFYGYNTLGQLVTVDELNVGDAASVRVESSVYDAISGQVVRRTDAKSQNTYYSYDMWNNLSSVTNAKNETTSYQYDWLGNMTGITNPDSSQKTKLYDEIGRLIKSTDQAGAAEKRFYDANGNLTRVVDRNGNEVNYQYDSRDRLTGQISTDKTVGYGYDDAGKRLWMTDSIGETQYTYDAYTGQLTEKEYPDGLQLTVDQYDLNGNRIQMTDPFGGVLSYTYDARDRLHSVGTDSSNADAVYSYTGNGLLSQKASGNGIVSSYSYKGQLLKELTQFTPVETVNELKYGYDDNKNISERIQNGQLDSYAYDELNRIAAASVGESYTYDMRGNRLTLETMVLPDIREMTNEFNIENELIEVTTSGSTVNYRYDGDGLLVERIENGETTRYYYDGDQIIAEAKVVNGVPELKARYIRGNQLEAIQYSSGEKAYVLHNGHGDIVELRGSSGALLNSYEYDMWGTPAAEQESVYNPFRYSGELWDSTTRLQYLRARWYDPSIGRFMNEDTYEGQIDNPLTLNLYTYTANNPLRYTDPSGHCFTEWLGKKYCEAALDSVKDSIINSWDNVSGYTQSQWNELVKIHSSWGSAVDYWTFGKVSEIKDYIEVSKEKPMSVEQWAMAGFLFSELSPQGKGGGIAAKGLMDSGVIRFTQDSISKVFKNGVNLDDTIKALKSGVLDPNDLPEIRIFNMNGNWFTLDNRRLYAAQQAGTQIKYVLATLEEITKDAWKFTTKNEGVSIKVRG